MGVYEDFDYNNLYDHWCHECSYCVFDEFLDDYRCLLNNQPLIQVYGNGCSDHWYRWAKERYMNED